MKKAEQKTIDRMVMDKYSLYHDNERFVGCRVGRRLRSCTAWVIKGDYGYYLRSYDTIIAVIPYDELVCYDFLRYVYGYTSTSTHHISKFARDYGNGTVLSWKGV